MWVSKKKYEELIEKQDELELVCNGWKAKYEAVTEDKVSYGNHALVLSYKTLDGMLAPLKETSQQLEDCKSELERYKRLYADELQKRLELAELVKDTMDK